MLHKKAGEIVFVALIAMIAITKSASAAPLTLGFEDIAPWSRINDGYGGLNWSGCATGPTCFNAGQAGTFVAQSGDRFAYLNSGDPDDSRPSDGVLSAEPGQVFDLQGGFFSANWRSGMGLEVIGLRSGVEIARHRFNLAFRSMTYHGLALEAVDTVHFRPYGGTVAGRSPLYAWQSFSFSMDDITLEIVDLADLEARAADKAAIATPSTLAIIAIGLALVLILRGRPGKF